jgi:acetyl-CoA carboxylase alpha subunit
MCIPNWGTPFFTLVIHSYDLYPYDYSFLDISMASLEQTIQQSVLKAAQTVEQQLDAELERLEKFDSDDLDSLREQRLKAMKKQAQQQQEWRVLVRYS